MFLYTIKEIYNFHINCTNQINDLKFESLSNLQDVGKALEGILLEFKDIYSRYAHNLPMFLTIAKKFYFKDDELRGFLGLSKYFSSESAAFMKFLGLLHVPFQRRKDIFSLTRKILQILPLGSIHHNIFLDYWKSYKVAITVIDEILSRSAASEELLDLESKLIKYTVQIKLNLYQGAKFK